MGAYNIVNPSHLVAGQLEDVGDVLANLQAIQAILNGGIDNSNINAAAAIAYSKLALANTIKLNADVDPATALAIARLAGYPADATKFLRGDGAWAAAAPTTYRKTSAKQVLNDITETDLFAGAITIGAGVMGVNGIMRITASGDWIQNSAAPRDAPRFKLKLGGTTLIDTGVFGATLAGAGAARWPWRIVCEITNNGAANVQSISYAGEIMFLNSGSGAGASNITTGEGKRFGWQASGTEWYELRDLGFNTAAVDTSIARLLELTVITPTAVATCDVTLKSALVEII